MLDKAKFYYLPFIVSLGLLTFFLGYYIRFVYQNEADRLKQEVKLLFDNAYESEKNKPWELMIDQIGNPFAEKDSLPPLGRKGKLRIGSNPSKIESYSDQKNQIVIQTYSNSKTVEQKGSNVIEKVIDLKEPRNDEKTLVDSIHSDFNKILIETFESDSTGLKLEDFKGKKPSIAVKLKVTSTFIDSSTISDQNKINTKEINQLVWNDQSKESNTKGKFPVIKFFSSSQKDTIQLSLMPVNIDTVKYRFDKLLIENNLPIRYKIDSLFKKDTSLIANDDPEIKYAAVPINNFWFITKKISPQIGLSFFVLASIIFGFLSMLQAMKKQEKLNLEKQQFLSNMTHELKTPLSIVGVALESIQRFEAKNIAEKRVEYVEIAQNENRKLVSLIDKILNFTKSTEEKLKLELVNPNVIITHVLNTFKPKIEDAKITINKDLEPSIPMILSNQEALIFILQNLIDNSIKYNDSQAPEITIKTNTLTDGSISITVEDNGIPIPAEFREKIFDKFYRVKNDMIHNQKGFGLGLYIAKEYTNAIGGRLEYLNAIKGNCFCLTLPKK